MLTDLHRVLAPALLSGAEQLCRAAFWLSCRAIELDAQAVELHHYLEQWERTLTGPDGWPE